MSRARSSADGGRRLTGLGLLATLGVALGGLWLIEWFPSQDGPSHAYNAWVLLRLAAEDPLYSAIYESRWDLVPNLLGTALLTGLGAITPLPIAEKLLLTVVVVGFSLGFASLVRREDGSLPPVAIAGPALILGAPLHLGFYSFSLGLALVPWGWALARRAAARPGWHAVALLALVAALAFAAHALAVLAVLAGAVTLALDAAWRDRRWHPAARVGIALVPAIALTAVYAAGFEGGETTRWPLDKLLTTLATLRAASAYTGWPEVAAMALALVLAALALWGARETGRRRAWLALAGGLTVVYLALPDGGEGFWFVSERLSLLPWLALAPLASPSRHRAAQAVVVGTVSLAVLGSALPHRARQSAEVAALVDFGRHLAPGETVLAVEAAPERTARTRPLLQAIGWAAIERGLVDAGNYEPHTDHFQTALGPYVAMPDPDRVMAAPETVDLRRFRSRIRYVVVIGAPDDALRSALRGGGYALAVERDELHLYERQHQRKGADM